MLQERLCLEEVINMDLARKIYLHTGEAKVCCGAGGRLMGSWHGTIAARWTDSACLQAL
jgi:hypothetical protein